MHRSSPRRQAPKTAAVAFGADSVRLGRAGAGRAIDRREFLRRAGTGVAGMAVLGLESCGGGGGGAGNGHVTLRWSMWSGGREETELWQQLADQVKARYPNITVKLETTGFLPYWDKLEAQVASNTQADIIGMQAQRMAGFAARGTLSALKDRIDENPRLDYKDFFPVIQQALSFRGQPRALAYDLGPPLLYFNRDLFKAAKVPVPSSTEPMSWGEFRQIASRLTDKDKGQYGFAQEWSFDFIIPWIWSNGGDYMDADATKSTLDTPEALGGMRFLANLYRDGIAAPFTDFTDLAGGFSRFISGKAAMYANGPWMIIGIRPSAKFDFDLAPAPAGTAGAVTWVAGSGFGVSSRTKHAEEAFKAIGVITGRAALKRLGASGRGYPARRSAVATFAEEKPPAHVGTVEEILESKLPDTRARPFRSTATWQETHVMLTRDLIPAIFLGEPPLESAVRTVKPQFDALLARSRDIVRRG